jgi:hypothetical protein
MADLFFDDLRVDAKIEAYEVVNNDFVQYSLRVGPQGPPRSAQELPPKRWFNKHESAFLDDRRVRLQVLLDTLLSHPLPPAPLRQFLEVEAHIDLDEMESAVANGNDSPRSALAVEGLRLNGIVNEALSQMIDVTRGEFDAVVDLESLKAQKISILEQLRLAGPVEPRKTKLPVSSTTVQTAEGILDTLARAPAIPLEEQVRLIERYGLFLVDAIRRETQVAAAAIGDGSDLVRHMKARE